MFNTEFSRRASLSIDLVFDLTCLASLVCLLFDLSSELKRCQDPFYTAKLQWFCLFYCE